MSVGTGQAVRMHCEDLATMLRELGLVLFACDLEGHLTESRSPVQRDWLSELVKSPRIVRRSLSKAAERWREEDRPRANTPAATRLSSTCKHLRLCIWVESERLRT